MNTVWKRQVALHVTLRAFLKKLTSRENVPRDTEQTTTPGVRISSVLIHTSTTWLLPLGHSCWETCWKMPSIYYLGFTWTFQPCIHRVGDDAGIARALPISPNRQVVPAVTNPCLTGAEWRRRSKTLCWAWLYTLALKNLRQKGELLQED